MGNFIFGLGSLLLAYGCIKSKFKKSIITTISEIVGFILMIIAYLIF